MELKFGERTVGTASPVYFIADIAANHDGDLNRAKALVRLAKEAGADAAKFQNFKAEKIVSDYGFRNMGGRQSHQASWRKSVFETYRDVSVQGSRRHIPERQKSDDSIYSDRKSVV